MCRGVKCKTEPKQLQFSIDFFMNLSESVLKLSSTINPDVS